ncbi:MAG TPA: hypothetical protein VGJ22_07960 [Anaerolineales bacterium]|jgi:hypothetical protein
MSAARTQPETTDPETGWTEVPVFVHGILPEADPASHAKEYNALLDAVNAALRRYGKRPFSSHRIYVEWGWDSRQSTQPDRYLAEVERKIAMHTNRAVKKTRDFTLNPLRLAYKPMRSLFFFGVADLFYYVSEDGETAVRTHVFDYVAGKIREMMRSPKTRLSLTFFGHSAGSLISHDLLFHLFGKKDAAKSEGPAMARDLNPVRGFIRHDRLRIRHLYTFGSPISTLALRSNSMIDKIRHSTLLQPRDIGLRASDRLPAPRWVNFWDQDDLFSGPVSFLYANRDGVIEDKYLNVGSFFPATHTTYWYSAEMADHIAKTF